MLERNVLPVKASNIRVDIFPIPSANNLIIFRAVKPD
jgi:hypothetical protein